LQHSSLFGCRKGERRSDGIFGLAGPISAASEKKYKNPSINQRLEFDLVLNNYRYFAVQFYRSRKLNTGQCVS
jgi:hypothetical protein